MSDTPTQKLPVLALRRTVLFPSQTVPIGAGRKKTLRALEAATQSGQRHIFAVAQRENLDEPIPEDLLQIGVVVRIVDVERSLSGVQVVVEAEHRASVQKYELVDGYLEATVTRVDDNPIADVDEPAFAALFKETRERAFELGEKRGVPREVLRQIMEAVTEPGHFTDLVAGYLNMPHEKRQKLLEELDVEERMRQVLIAVQRELDVLTAQEKIHSQVKEELGERQREVYLREQLKAIQRELGDAGDDSDELEELRAKLEKLELPEDARKEVNRELARLQRTSRESMEAQVIRTYLEWIVELPWNTRSDDKLDLKEAIRVLEEDHYGLRDVKDRVLEFLAIRQMRASAGKNDGDTPSRAPILLFVGPPGVGKTSIAKSVARALGREYVRVSLGGVRDEADIRGHRRTYVGAMPGRIIQGMKQAGSKNPVFVLDEVDKLGVSFQGDPASALLEVLDPAQNDSFTDHYLNVPFDVSEVLFVATANFIQNIPAPLLDRMEVVEFSGYTEREKVEIAKRYLLPRQLDEAGMDAKGIEFTDDGLYAIVSRYTRESGVRQTERQIGKLIRKIARKIAAGEDAKMTIDADAVRELLGRPRVRPEQTNRTSEVGVATGMYYTPVGGDIMFVEAAIRELSGKPPTDEHVVSGLGNVSLILTGQLGDVMKESARAALTYATTHATELGISAEHLGSVEAHIHVPAGAIPKDGPSAGVTMATALVSAMSGRPVRRDVAMTGEVTLRGRVLPIGGVKEKVLGAHRAGAKLIVLPAENEADLEDVPEEAVRDLEFRFVEHLDEVLDVALLPVGHRDAPTMAAH